MLPAHDDTSGLSKQSCRGRWLEPSRDSSPAYVGTRPVSTTPTFGAVCGVCWWVHAFTSVQWVSTCENKGGPRRWCSWAHAWLSTWPILQLILENVIQMDHKTTKNSQKKFFFFLLFHKSLIFFSSLQPYKDYVWSSNNTELQMK